MAELEKRTWVYVQPPSQYGIPGCACGNCDTQWSEFKDRLWCDKCKIDFEPEHWGVFDGPIPVGASMILGMCFDVFNLETQQIEPFVFETPDWPEVTSEQGQQIDKMLAPEFEKGDWQTVESE